MALNFQQIFESIKQIGMGARQRRVELESQRALARELLGSWADRPAELRIKVERATQADPNLRCAIPLEGRLDASFPAPDIHKFPTVLAADGSQIIPDRHAAVQYCLVNVGAIALVPGSSQSPEVFTDSRLKFGDELYTPSGMLTEDAIGMTRDIAEREKLLELVPGFPPPVIALTDGPVELWGAKGGDTQDYRRSVEKLRSVLSQLQEKAAIVAGYVDKPAASLLVRTLEISRLSSDQEFKDVRNLHTLRGATDLWLFGNLLHAGHRSAVFGLQSSSCKHYTGDLSLHFFYLNVGDAGHASLARVEIPRWVALDPGMLDLLHAALLQQCRIMGVRPYPYILHRAHEIAVVKFEEKKQVEQMLELELQIAGDEVGSISNKQSAKDLPGRKNRK